MASSTVTALRCCAGRAVTRRRSVERPGSRGASETSTRCHPVVSETTVRPLCTRLRRAVRGRWDTNLQVRPAGHPQRGRVGGPAGPSSRAFGHAGGQHARRVAGRAHSRGVVACVGARHLQCNRGLAGRLCSSRGARARSRRCAGPVDTGVCVGVGRGDRRGRRCHGGGGAHRDRPGGAARAGTVGDGQPGGVGAGGRVDVAGVGDDDVSPHRRPAPRGRRSEDVSLNATVSGAAPLAGDASKDAVGLDGVGVELETRSR